MWSLLFGKRIESIIGKTGVTRKAITANTYTLDGIVVEGRVYDVISSVDIEKDALVYVIGVEDGYAKIERMLDEDIEDRLVNVDNDLTTIEQKTGQTVSPSDDLLLSSDSEVITGETSFTKVKEFKIFLSGKYRIKFDLHRDPNYGSDVAYGKIYKNGAGFGTRRQTTSATYVTFTEDLVFEEGDLCQLYIKSKILAAAAYARNFRLYGTIGLSVGVEQDV